MWDFGSDRHIIVVSRICGERLILWGNTGLVVKDCNSRVRDCNEGQC